MKKIVSFVKSIFICIFLVGILIFACIVYDGYRLYQEVIAKESIEEKVKKITSKDDYLLYSYIPKDFVKATVSIEDHRFFHHSGVDVISIGRAFVTNIQDKNLSQGGSTITQQLAKNMYFEFNKDFSRKIAEMFVAIDLEKNYEKEEIFAMYTNIIYFGEGYYGLNDAAKGYYNKKVSDLNFDEITLLAGIPNAPSVYNPVQNPNLAVQRQKLVKEAMESANIKLK